MGTAYSSPDQSRLLADVAALQNAYTQAQGHVAALQTAYSQSQGQVAALQAQVANLAQTVSQQQAAIVALQASNAWGCYQSTHDTNPS
jgi:capsule polysaccharide export protein KpsE/RkpR